MIADITKAEFITYVKSRLGRATDDELNPLIELEGTLAQDELEQKPWHPWFLLERREVALPAAVADVEVSAYALLEDRYDAAICRAADHVCLLHDELQKIRHAVQQAGSKTGPPTHFHLHAQRLYVYPRPDQAYTLLVMGYWAQPPFRGLAPTAANAWLRYAFDWLAAATCFRLARHMRDTEAIAMFAAEMQRAEAQVYAQHVAYTEAGRDRVMGG